MRRFFRRFPTHQFWLVAVGIGLGYLARQILGSPETAEPPAPSFQQPVVKPETEVIDLPIIRSLKDSSENEF